MKAKTAPAKIPCPYGCGMETAPGPMRQHQKACALRPNRKPFTVEQPTGVCKWGCGLETTLGALTTHERYGCKLLPGGKDQGDARVTCEFCGKVRTMPGAMVRHHNVCPANPANPQMIGRVTAAGKFVAS